MNDLVAYMSLEHTDTRVGGPCLCKAANMDVLENIAIIPVTTLSSESQEIGGQQMTGYVHYVLICNTCPMLKRSSDFGLTQPRRL